jgi:hypothetical protein
VEAFWRRQEAATGRSREEVLTELRRLFGHAFTPRTEEELRAAIDKTKSKS